VLILLGADPLADFPDRDLAARALAAVPTIISCDLFLTESTELAHIVLPAAGHAEKDGTTTNIEGRVSRLGQKVTPPGTARADWMIAAELAFQLGSDLMLESAEDIWDEIVTLAPAYRDLEVEALGGFVAGDGVLVPFPTLRAAAYGGNGETGADAAPEVVAEPAPEPEAAASVAPDVPDDDADSTDASPDTEAADETAPAADPNPAPAVFQLAPGAPVVPAPLDAYALRLIASRKLYDDGTFVQQSPSLAPLSPGTVLRVNSYDFARLGVAVGAQVRIKTPKGQAMVAIQVDDGVPRGAAAVYVNQPGLALTELIDATARVTDVRVDSGADA
jgi:predicted molibdopterin-dependent oxidoreductase YjgC